jgi:HD-GYP domain-containing protein (c-di-GMP phosphodiesterase class II)
MGEVSVAATGSEVRLAEVVATLSLATDLGYGQPMEHVLRSCLIALRLGEQLGLDASERAVVYYVGLLACVGCYADAHEQARWFGDDIALKAAIYGVDLAGLPMMSFMMRRVGSGEAPHHRAARRIAFMAGGRREVEGMFVTHCVLTGRLAESLGLGPKVQEGLRHAYERWDGKGEPDGRVGDDVAISSRLMRLARAAEVFHRAGGPSAAIEVARDRRGSEFDPSLVDLFVESAPKLLEDVASTDGWETVIGAEPELAIVLSDAEFESALESIADYVDLKSPFTLGHSRGVADLAESAARRQGMSDADVGLLRRAGLVHDLGRLGVSNTIWDKPGPLTASEWERVRLHPYLTERMLAASQALGPLATLAARHHERLDGSGYARGLSGTALSPGARILAAADVYHAATEPRPYRPAHPPEDAASEVRAEVSAGRLDGDTVEAVLGAAGHQERRRRERPAGLTAREVEVLRLLARGVSNKEIARRLVISGSTAGKHVEHIYAKLDVSSRAAASLLAVQHGLLPEQPQPAAAKDQPNAP